ncbi:MAG TPA: helix-turn-helix domain-containing protein [Candidatus Eisenbacteria bacterium]|nr:helix-turn-helix domain-containing protein [Candidatus Eisenbacteria bacterium]
MHRRFQFDKRENPASDRRHDSRQGLGSFSGGNGRDEESGASLPLTNGPNYVYADTSGIPQAAAPRAAKGAGEYDGDGLLTIQQVAAILHVPVSWVYGRTRKRSSQRLPGIRLGKYWRFREEEIHRWIESQRGGDCAS